MINRLVMSKLEVVYRRSFQFWLIFPNQNYQSRSKEYNFNWCWHRTLPLKMKRFSIFENLLKSSGTTTKVLSCLKIPLTSMRFIVSPDLANSSLPFPPPELVSWSPWRNSSTASAEEFYYSFYYKEGLENILTRAPLLGLAKSIYHFLSFKPSESGCGKNCWNSRLSCSGCLTAINS